MTGAEFEVSGCGGSAVAASFTVMVKVAFTSAAMPSSAVMVTV